MFWHLQIHLLCCEWSSKFALPKINARRKLVFTCSMWKYSFVLGACVWWHTWQPGTPFWRVFVWLAPSLASAWTKSLCSLMLALIVTVSDRIIEQSIATLTTSPPPCKLQTCHIMKEIISVVEASMSWSIANWTIVAWNPQKGEFHNHQSYNVYC